METDSGPQLSLKDLRENLKEGNSHIFLLSPLSLRQRCESLVP
jgi:hypothetical protein